MSTHLVLTIIGSDKPGLVESISEVVVDHGGNWSESRMARLGGQFAGILLCTVPTHRSESLGESLRALEAEGLRVVVEPAQPATEPTTNAGHELRLGLVGNDRPGIIKEISQALAERSVNVEELHTEISSAPMSGDILFKADLRLRVPEGTSHDDLRGAIEEIAHDLMVDIDLE
jgi:glycine cleavage system regulatory protein